MSSELHSLLVRQLRKLGLDPETSPDLGSFRTLLTNISRTYRDVDQDRYLLERSQDIASNEMSALYRQLEVSQARLKSLLSLSSDWVWEQSVDGCFTFVSDELEERTGLNSSALLNNACGIAGPLRTEPADFTRLQEHLALRQPFHDITFEVLSDRGKWHHMRISGEPVFEGSLLVGYRGVGRDITALVMADRKIQELARFDSLTGLPNRYMFMEELDLALARGKRYNRHFALLFIDLDRFKSVNDNLGHTVGDVVLNAVGERLKTLLRKIDMLGRIGGDEFVVLMESNDEHASLSIVASRILHAVTEPLEIEGRSIQISASVGISIYPSDGEDAASLLKAADAAMYQAKVRGRNTFEFFTADLTHRAELHFALEGDLRLAIERKQLVLHYQPQIDAINGELVGLEALIRWQHHERGLLSPAMFIDLAEESGLIIPIGRWVLQTACSQMAAWRAAGLVPPRCAINVSARQLTDDGLVDDVRLALEHSGISAQDLEIEVTESLLMADAQLASTVLEKLRALGVHIAIDDFGTGYSSLAYLKKFPAQTLKIDRSFVCDLPTDTDNLAITRAVVAMGHSLGMRIIAEGVETEEQQSCLRRLGCDVLQGYLFSRPMTAEAMREHISNIAGAVLCH